MSQSDTFPLVYDIVPAFVPVNMAAADNNGTYVSVKDTAQMWLVLYKAAGAATEPPTVTLQQARNVAGDGVKPLAAIDRVWHKQGAALGSVGTWSFVPQAAASTFSHADSGNLQALWVMNIDLADLDAAENYDVVRAVVADVGATAQLGCAFYILQRVHAQDVPTSPVVD